MLVVGGWINWKYNQLSPMLVVGGWINWKYNQVSPIWWLVAELTGNNYCHTRTQLKILAHLISISDDKLGPARAL